MKLLKLLGLTSITAFGVFVVVFGEFDDSPGASVLGLIIAGTGIFGLIKLLKKSR